MVCSSSIWSLFFSCLTDARTIDELAGLGIDVADLREVY